MKKKIALLLAIVMSFSVLPATALFAADSDARISSNLLVVPPESVLKQNAKGDSALNDTVFEAPYLVLTFTDDTRYQPDTFRLKLENAKWDLGYVSEGATLNGYGVISDGIADGDFVAIQDINGKYYNYVSKDGDSGYTFRLDNYDDSRIATITNVFGKKGDEIAIPLTVKIDDVTDVALVTLYDSNTTVKTGTLMFATSVTDGTRLSNEAVNGRELIKLNDIVITENRPGTIATGGSFEIVAPDGYRFANNPETQWRWSVVYGLTADMTPPYTYTNYNKGTSTLYDVTLTENNDLFLFSSYVGAWGGSSTPGTSGSANVNNADGYTSGTSNSLNITVPRATDLSNGYQDHYKLIIPKGSIIKSTDTRQTGKLVLSNIWIEPIDERYVVTGTELYIEIKGVSDLNISSGKVKVATVVDWGVSYTAESAKAIVSGLLNQETAKVTIEETLRGAWLPTNGYGSATFTLPEGVKLNTIEFKTWDNVSGNTPNPGKVTLLGNTNVSVSKYTNDCLTVDNDGRSFTIRGLEQATSGKAKIQFILNVTVSPDFDGDTIDLEVTGSAIPEETKGATVNIATLTHPITIDAKTTDVEIGYQSYKVGDVTITETATGKISAGRLILSLTGGSDGDLTFAPITSDQVTFSDNLRATLVRGSNGEITFDIGRGALNGTASITIKNLEVRVNRNVPWGSYDLVVYGDSIYKNYSIWGSNQVTQTSTTRSPLISFGASNEGYTAPYISVVTAGTNSATFKNVKITADSTQIIVGDDVIELEVAPFIDPESNSFLVPVRFVAEALGVPAEDVLWDRTSSTVTILSRSNNRTVKFTSGSETMYVNDGAQTMETNGQIVKAKIVNERMFIPFRYIGNALGITNDKIAWDQDTRTAEFNPAE